MKAATTVAIVLTATPAFADPGHVAQQGGHSHWLAAGAFATAVIIAAVALWRSRRKVTERKA